MAYIGYIIWVLTDKSSLLVGSALAQKSCPNNSCSGMGFNEAFKACRDYFPDYISEPNYGK